MGNKELFEKAVETALSILDHGDNTAMTLRLKLYTRKIDRHIADAAVEYVVEHGYVDDERYAANYVESARRKLLGPRYIKKILLTRGISAKIADAAVEKYDFDDICEKCFEKYFGEPAEDKKERLKQAQRMLIKGFTTEQIHRICRL